MRLKGLKTLLVACLSLWVMAFLCSCSRQSGPEKDLRIFTNSLVEKEWDVAWDSLAYRDQKAYEEKIFKPIQAKFMKTPDDKKSLKDPVLGISVQDLLAMTARDFWRLQMEKTGLRDDILKKLGPETMKVISVSIQGNTAKLKMEGNLKEITMIKEQGRWRICIF